MDFDTIHHNILLGHLGYYIATFLLIRTFPVNVHGRFADTYRIIPALTFTHIDNYILEEIICWFLVQYLHYMTDAQPYLTIQDLDDRKVLTQCLESVRTWLYQNKFHFVKDNPSLLAIFKISSCL